MRPKVAVIAVSSPSGETGGAERFYEGLVNALNSAGVLAELISLVSDESNFEAIKESYLRFYDLNLSDYDGVISTKAPAYLIRHPNHICYLQHTMRVFYDMFKHEYPQPTIELYKQQQLIHQLDTSALQYPRTRKIFVIGNEVKERLWRYNGLDSEVLYQSLTFDNFKHGSYEYIFMPGRLHRWKRVDLIIKAMSFVKRPVTLKISGTGEDEDAFHELAKQDKRIIFCGRVSDQNLVELYANALVVPFIPVREDFGLVTLEAFRSCKPIITCTDSGEPAHIVRDCETGFVCPPEPEIIGDKLEYLYDHPKIAEDMGFLGAESIQHITWKNVAEKLISALETGFFKS